MTLSVIGAGFGRTGTTSMKVALELLGFGPCYHMAEVQEHTEHVTVWASAIQGEPIDWDQHLGAYGSTLDWPACTFWRELAVHYPEAKVLLTVRDPDSWYESVMATGYRIVVKLHEMAEAAGEPNPGNLLVAEGKLLDYFPDKDKAIAWFNRHNALVQATVPASRLLVFEASDGWDPLCAFLDRDVPDVAYPSSNSTKEFWTRSAR